MQGVGGVEIQGPHGEGYHGCVCAEGPKEGHRSAEHSKCLLIVCASLCMHINHPLCVCVYVKHTMPESRVQHNLQSES